MDNATATINQHSCTDNPSWANSASMYGDWYNFMNPQEQNISIRVSAGTANTLAPAFTVWASGQSKFDGGSTNEFETSNISLSSVPHVFNATGKLGDPGTNWMRTGG